MSRDKIYNVSHNGENMKQNSDGAWEKAEPLPMQGWKAQLEIFFYRVHLKPLGRLMAWWDERGLGK